MSKKIIVTKKKIGKITYIIESSSSEKATIPLDRKIEKLILRDVKNNLAVKVI